MSSPPGDIGGTVAISLAHWRAFSQSSGEWDAAEYPLFTDAHLVGEAPAGLGPYQLINTGAGPGFANGVPSAVLRVRIPHFDGLSAPRLPDMEKTDATRYHGGTLEDEVTALIALELGIRLKPGPMTRWFLSGPGSDPFGRPVAWAQLARSAPTLAHRQPPRIPGMVVGERDLGACERLKRLELVPSEASAHLVKAARLYQEAGWISDVDPALSWLLLVAAVETAANDWRASADSPLERLRASAVGPELERVLKEAGGETLVERVAHLVVDYLGATKKFVDFLLEFHPTPPDPRPPDSLAIDWSPSRLKRTLSKIYEYRSKALHEGTPFPYPMGDSPYQFDGGALAERPHGLAAATLGGVWQADDMPMVINAFHYIARGALLQWWDRLVASATPS